MKTEIRQIIQKEKIIAIMRGVETKNCVETARALYQGGIVLLEIPFSQGSGASEQTKESLKAVSRELGGKVILGAGTVTTAEQLEIAWSEGAKYFISPVFDRNLIALANKMDMVSIPGAMTPTEALAASRAGADFVKIFPAEVMGIHYFKSILAPLGNISLLAVGGVDENNMLEYLRNGAVGVGIGKNLVNPQWIQEERYARIRERASELVNKRKLWEGDGIRE